jgi:hypothetical protein
LVVGGGDVAGAACASTLAGAANQAAATNIVPARKIAFIGSGFSSDRRSFPARRATGHARRVPNIQALGG